MNADISKEIKAPPFQNLFQALEGPMMELQKINWSFRVTPYPKCRRDEVLFMAIKKELTKEERVSKEITRLKRIYKEMPKDTLLVVEGLIVEAADLRVRLEDIRKDLDENGYDEMFSQSENQEPYERERPQARRYIAMNKNYQSIMKQLGDYVPKPDLKKKEETDDGFEKFVQNR